MRFEKLLCGPHVFLKLFLVNQVHHSLNINLLISMLMFFISYNQKIFISIKFH